MVSNIFSLLFATVAAIFVIGGLLKSKEYESFVENLEGNEFPLKSMYTIGLFWNSKKPFTIQGKLWDKLKQEATLLYGKTHCEYYALIIWAQFLSISFLVVAVFTCFAAFMDSTESFIFLAVAAVGVYIVWGMSVGHPKKVLTERQEICDDEFPNMVSKLSLLINSGMVLREAWKLIAQSKQDHPLYDLMRTSIDDMDNGMSDVEALHKFAQESGSVEIKKFASTIAQGIEKGSRELVGLLLTQSTELWSQKRQRSLRKGEVASGKLILPLVITFVGIIFIILSAALTGLSLF